MMDLMIITGGTNKVVITTWDDYVRENNCFENDELTLMLDALKTYGGYRFEGFVGCYWDIIVLDDVLEVIELCEEL